jgi:hypothetical protein
MRTIEDVLNRLRAEFREMPGLRLSARFLYAKPDGHYARLTDGADRPRAQHA